jgi:hypothetical protein
MTNMTMRNMTVHDCHTVRVEADGENGCVEITCYDARRGQMTAITILVFGPDDKPPLLEVAKKSFTGVALVED